MKYLIFVGNICQMGGAQKYVSNKVSFLKNKGWEVFVFSVRNGEIIIKELREYEKLIHPELLNIPNIFSKKDREKIIDCIVNTLGDCINQEIVIESNTGNLSLWAELVAQRINAKHFCFLLDEVFNIDKGIIEFFEYKNERNELALIREKSYELLFGKKESEENKKVNILTAICNNVTDNVEDERFNKIPYDKYDWVICSIGRLDKGYIPNVISGFHDFAKNNEESRIAYIFIGDQPQGYKPDMYAEINETLSALPNVDVYQMGYIYPIPNSFFSRINIGVASAGSATVLWTNNVVTISMDANDFNPIGVLGYTTQNRMFRENEDIIPLHVLLQKILVENYLKDRDYKFLELQNMDEYFLKHLEFIDKMDKNRKYYDVCSINLKDKKNLLKRLLLKTLGYKRFLTLKKLFERE